MKLIRTEDAVGHVLCHDMTRIVKGVSKGPAFRKGHVVAPEDIPVLLSMGKENLYVWEKEPGMLHENEAAEILYQICAGGAENLVPSEVKEGKIEVSAGEDGLLLIDTDRLQKLNSLGELMIATRHGHQAVRKGDKLAGTRIIPLVIRAEKMEAARAAAGDKPLLELRPFRPRKVAIVTTGSEVQKGLITDTFTPVLEEKVGEYGCQVMGHVCPGDDPAAITAAILDYKAQGAELILCSGGMSVDPDDRTPLAIKNTGARVVSYGAPVLPGAMLMVAYLDGVPVAGLPGCVMYAKRTVFDLVLPLFLAGVPVRLEDLAAMGHGGLCLNCEVCTYPNCGFGKGW
ncbi:molybdopterin-binding protein [Pseudoflavonifractor phocaeensis]|uniref:molybdopterin-binding protein n=1 Tax=Pseudoflavonifractor phocaeensis TaxID=1870988 RepID=UPI00313BD2DF